MDKTIRQLGIITILFFISYSASSQTPKKDKYKEAKELDAAVKAMHIQGMAQIPKEGVCGSGDSVFVYAASNELSFQDIIEQTKKLIAKWNGYGYLEKGFRTSAFDFMFLKFDKKDTFIEFTKKVSKIDYEKLTDKQLKELKEIYATLRIFILGEIPLIGADTEPRNGCYNEAYLSIKLKSRSVSSVVWELNTKVNLFCHCKDPNSKTKILNLSYKYTAVINGRFRSDKISFDKPKKTLFKIIKYKCCPGTKVGYLDDPSSEIPKTENVSVGSDHKEESSSFMEVSAGVATAKDEETLFCIGLGIMFHVSNLAGNPFYLGARAKLETASFSAQNFNQTQIAGGPSVEYHVPIGKTSTRWINGINGAYKFGSSESSGFKTNISGFTVGLYSGVHVPLGDIFALGVILNLVEYNNLTFKADDDSFENKATSTGFNFNKGSAAISLRMNLFKGTGGVR